MGYWERFYKIWQLWVGSVVVAINIFIHRQNGKTSKLLEKWNKTITHSLLEWVINFRKRVLLPERLNYSLDLTGKQNKNCFFFGDHVTGSLSCQSIIYQVKSPCNGFVWHAKSPSNKSIRFPTLNWFEITRGKEGV